MHDIRVDKDKLLEVLSFNRGEHRAIFEAATLAYREAAIAALDRRIQELRDGKPVTMTFGLVVPEDHTDDYDRVIGMLEMSLDNEVDLPEHEYTQFVDDDWSWKRQWQASTASYVAQ